MTFFVLLIVMARTRVFSLRNPSSFPVGPFSLVLENMQDVKGQYAYHDAMAEVFHD
jgi:hypothetical protein